MSFKSIAVLLAATCVVGAGCSSSSKSASSTSTTAVPTSSPVKVPETLPGGLYKPPVCPTTAGAPITATPVAGSKSDYDVVSFDGTKIRAHWFPLAKFPAGGTAPTVLEGPGWGESGNTDTTSSNADLFGGLSISGLHSAGYNVLTWDPRGFGKSGGTIETDSPDFEGRDVEQLISWVAQQPGVELDAPGNPRMGMVGASYGGGIQLVTAALDCRVDAIVPQISWNSLGPSLYEADTVKQGWGDLLYTAAAGRSLDPHITSAHTQGDATGTLTAADQQWFLDRGPGDSVNKITAPTLLEQGTIDTLFPLNQAITNFSILHANGIPTAMLWMCSGHGVCLTNPGQQKLAGEDTIAWLNRYVQDNTKARIVAPFEYVDQNGVEYTAEQYPLPALGSITATGSGTLTLVDGGGSGPAHARGNPGTVGGLALPITPAKASHAVNLVVTSPSAANVVGAPTLTLDYSGTSPAGVKPTRVFAQLVDNATGIVIGNQITPIDVTLDGKSHTTTVPLETIAFTETPRANVTLQIVETTTAYAKPRLGGKITFKSIEIALPTVTGVTRQPASGSEVR